MFVNLKVEHIFIDKLKKIKLQYKFNSIYYNDYVFIWWEISIYIYKQN